MNQETLHFQEHEPDRRFPAAAAGLEDTQQSAPLNVGSDERPSASSGPRTAPRTARLGAQRALEVPRVGLWDCRLPHTGTCRSGQVRWSPFPGGPCQTGDSPWRETAEHKRVMVFYAAAACEINSWT